jgi:hypothetical protein
MFPMSISESKTTKEQTRLMVVAVAYTDIELDARIVLMD